MQPAAAHARFRIRESLDAHPELTVILDSSSSPSSRLQGRFLAQGDDGSIEIQLNTALGENTLVSIAGEVQSSSGKVPLLGHYRVRSCRLAGIEKYRVELVPEIAAQEPISKEQAPKDTAVPAIDEDLDCYEIMQVSRNADSDTIRRIFHMLAQRYHPDNRDTGSDHRFRQVVAANLILSDPEKRAAYDVQLRVEDKTRFRIFESAQSTEGVQAEIRKRQGILRLLYTKRSTDANDGGMRGRDFVELLGIPFEHLEFAFWYLREKKLIHRSDNNRFEITSAGVEAFEDAQPAYAKKPLIALPAASAG